MEVIDLFILMIVGHILCDFSLQSDFIAKGKLGKIEHVPGWFIMGCHCFLHAASIFLITSNPFLTLGEFVAHYVIDNAKKYQVIGFLTDQFLHVYVKLIWLGIYFYLQEVK